MLRLVDTLIIILISHNSIQFRTACSWSPRSYDTGSGEHWKHLPDFFTQLFWGAAAAFAAVNVLICFGKRLLCRDRRMLMPYCLFMSILR
jgi:hypothetical protein